ncbi:MAG: hypothetical protein JXQ71_01605 [Verrucomicrobia bacterium]|nr:hypothetical protein [Verrucomicrobiota bacterium]
MFWIIALVIIAIAAAEGYFIGAIRAAFAFLGLVLGCLLAIPLSPLAKPLLGLFGVRHFVVVAFIAPLVVWVVVLLAVRALGESVNYKVNYFYKYKVGDELRLFWERLSQRLGGCVGVLNGALYGFSLSVFVYTLGYPVVQVASSDQDPFMFRVVNQLALSMQSAGVDKCVAPFAPKDKLLYDASDLVGLVCQNPHIQTRLGKYPPFLTLMERPEFKELRTDKDFQAVWKGHPPFKQLLEHPRIQPLVTNAETYDLVLNTLDGDLDDLREYLNTGKSPKYADTLILGKWLLSVSRSYRQARRANLGAVAKERELLRQRYDTELKRSTLTAFVDNKILLRAGGGTNAAATLRGTWKQNSRHTYVLSVSGVGKAQADVEDHKLTFTWNGLPVVFLK